jgi:hypothetical protein
MSHHLLFLKTDIAHRGMGEYRGRGRQKSKSLHRDRPENEVTDRMRDYASEPDVTAVTATQTTRVSDTKPDAWYFRVFRGVEYEEIMQRLQENERLGFESQRNTILMRIR